MNLSNKLYVLSQFGIVDWLNSGKDDENIGLIVDLLADYFFDEKTCMDFATLSENGEIYYHFVESGYDIGWYELMSNKFVNNFDIIYSMNCIEDRGTTIYGKELKRAITDWIFDWSNDCRKEFIKKLEESK